MAKIIIVEDDQDLALMIKESLRYEHDVIEIFNNGSDAEHALALFEFDLAILDWDLPELSGIELLRKIRAGGKNLATIMVTGKSSIRDKETGFDVGADDYLTKPFLPRELLVRVRAVLRRSAGASQNVVQYGKVSVDLKNGQVLLDSIPIQLSKKEFQVLELLIRNAGEVFSPEAILKRVWPSDTEVSLEASRYIVKQLRKKLTGADGNCPIQNIHGFGYKLVN